MGLNGLRRPDGQLTPGAAPPTQPKPAKEPAGAVNQRKAPRPRLSGQPPIHLCFGRQGADASFASYRYRGTKELTVILANQQPVP